MVTIYDVAREAGINHTTVSHAFSGKRSVAPATRERVFEAARKLGYHANAAARSLASHNTHIIGLAAPLDLPMRALAEGSFSRFIMSIGDRLNDHGYKMLCLVSPDPDTSDLVGIVRGGHVDGMLLLQVRTGDPRIAAMQAEGIPFVAIGRPRDAAGIVRVDADFGLAAEMAVNHLVQLGHHEISMLTAFSSGEPVFGFQYHALAGFRRAHKALGLRLQRGQVLRHGEHTGIAEALEPFLATKPRTACTAIVTSTDIEAATTLRLLSANGIRVPDDISLLALADTALTDLANPPITAVRFSPEAMSRTAVDLVVAMLAGQRPRRTEHLVPVELVERESTRRRGVACVSMQSRTSAIASAHVEQ